MNTSIIKNISTNSSTFSSEIISNNLHNATTNTSIIENISTNSSSFLNEVISNNVQNATTILSKIDPNWFYSASAQSAAAIVGLMGAFITTKILNQKLYIKQLSKETDEINIKVLHIHNEIVKISNLLDELDKDEGIKYVKSLIKNFDPSKIPDLEYTNIIERTASSSTKLNLENYRKYKNEIVAKNGEILFFENLLRYKNEQLESNKEFIDLKNYFRTLFIFSILGVFLPLFMLLLDYNIMIRFRFHTFFLILLGWLIILISLNVEIKNLRE